MQENKICNDKAKKNSGKFVFVILAKCVASLFSSKSIILIFLWLYTNIVIIFKCACINTSVKIGTYGLKFEACEIPTRASFSKHSFVSCQTNIRVFFAT